MRFTGSEHNIIMQFYIAAIDGFYVMDIQYDTFVQMVHFFSV